VTLKGQVMTPICFGAYYLDNGWSYRLVYNAAPIENGIFGIKFDEFT